MLYLECIQLPGNPPHLGSQIHESSRRWDDLIWRVPELLCESAFAPTRPLASPEARLSPPRRGRAAHRARGTPPPSRRRRAVPESGNGPIHGRYGWQRPSPEMLGPDRVGVNRMLGRRHPKSFSPPDHPKGTYRRQKHLPGAVKGQAGRGLKQFFRPSQPPHSARNPSFVPAANSMRNHKFGLAGRNRRKSGNSQHSRSVDTILATSRTP